MAVHVLILQIMQSILGLLGVIGNTIVAVVIYKVPYMHTTTDAFIFNQAAIDCLGSLLLILRSNVPEPDSYPDTPWYFFVCHVWKTGLLLWALFTSSTVNLVVLISERYIALVYPLRYVRFFNKRSVAFIITAVWLFGLLAEVLYVAAVIKMEDGRCFGTSSNFSKILGVIFILVKFFIPSLLMLFFFGHVYMKLRKRPDHTRDSVPTLSEEQMQPVHRASHIALKTLLLVFITFLLCWTLNEVLFLMFNFGLYTDVSGPVYTTSVALVATNLCVNPFIFAFKYKRFRRALSSLVHGSPLSENQLLQRSEVITLQTRAEMNQPEN